ncbi:MAG: hypothetical protein CVT59_11395 [Actinobacteria bacterium HGW-Actinobacteria-1]|jgi:uncharacterized membrane protein|nr:MAG: hypothetical protein CVT59_11395 [Actinobacteria bacterium HGW-Actinobacteria-1]
MLSSVFHWVGYGLCHQLPERSLFAGGFQLPVCARDTGIYAGFVLSLIVISLVERRRRPSELSRPWLVVVGVLIFGTMVVDGVSSYAGWRETSNDLRLITGLLAGYAMTLAVVPMVNGQLWTSVSRTRLLEGWRSAAWLLSIPVSFVVLRWALPAMGVIYPVLLTLAIVATYAAVNLIFVTFVPVLEHKATSLLRAPLQIALALALVAVELFLASGLRIAVERFAAGF